MGRVLLLVLIVVAIWLLWKAFGPDSQKQQYDQNQPPAIKGPDDDEDFLWSIEKERFKQRREQEAREQAAREQAAREQAAREKAQREEEQKRHRGNDEPSGDA